MRWLAASCRLTILALLSASVAGCSPEAHRYIRFPNLEHPGPAYMQRAAAIQHDPYPLNDVGPEIVGGRPLSYQQPLNEVERAHLTPQRPGVLQPVPVPSLSTAAPPAVVSPYPPAAPPAIAAPYPATASPIATAPYPPAPAPIVASPYPATLYPQSTQFQAQQRPRY